MLGAILAISVITSPPPSLEKKLVLDNGVVIFVNAIPSQRSFFLHMFVSTSAMPEKPGELGTRHLLEHLLAKGQKKDIDAKLESRGIFLSAATTRDGIRFEMEGPPESLPTAIESLREYFSLRAMTSEEIKNESKIMLQEEATRSWVARLLSGLTNHAFGTTASDPFGTVSEIAQVTPELLTKAHLEMFVAPSICVSVVGALDQLSTASQLESLFKSLPKSTKRVAQLRILESPTQEAIIPNANGRARGVMVGSASKTETLAVLAAGFALAVECPGATVSYAPSPHESLVSLLHPNRTGLDTVDRLIASEPDRLFQIGKSVLLRWIATAQNNSRENARTYGQMLIYEGFFRLEDLLRRANELTRNDFNKALNMFNSENCVRVGGER